MRKQIICIMRKQMAVTAKLISTFVFATWIVHFFPFQIRNFKLVALFYDCISNFVSDLFKNHIVGFPMRRFIYCTYHSLLKAVP